MLLRKWKPRSQGSPPETPDVFIADRFRETFAEPLSLAKREAMKELFPSKRRGRPRAGPEAPKRAKVAGHFLLAEAQSKLFGRTISFLVNHNDTLSIV